MSNPEHQIVIKDITTKVNNPRVDLMKDEVIRKPFIFKGYKSEEDRIKDAIYNNRLLYNLPDYPDFKKKNSVENKDNENEVNEAKNTVYNFNIDIPKQFKIINVNEVNEFDSKKRESISNTIQPRRRRKSIFNLNQDESNNLENVEEKEKEKDNLLKKEKKEKKVKTNIDILRKFSIVDKKMLNDLAKNNAIYQPKMKFRARTDLERVYDMLNLQSLKENDRQIVERQLTNIDLYTYKKPKELLNEKKKKVKINNDGRSYEILPNPIIEEQKKQNEKIQNKKKIYGDRNLYYEPKNNYNKLWARKNNLNLEARKLLNSYHYKTHFKATEEMQFKVNHKKSNSDYTDPEINSINTCLMIPNLFNSENLEINDKNTKKILNLKNQFNNKGPRCNSNNNYSVDLFNFEEDIYRDDNDNRTIDFNEYKNTYQNNPNLRNLKFSSSDESMKNLFKMAFEKEHNLDEGKKKNENSNNNYRYSINENEYKSRNIHNILVNNENIHNTAKLILDECKVHSIKSKFNNSFLKSKNGKTMITKGLSVDQFLKKYNLNFK